MLITLIPFTAIIITVYVLSLHTVQLKGDCDVACANKHQRSKYPFFELKDEVNPMAPGQKETSLISYELEELTTTVIRASPYKIRSSFWNAPTEKDFFMEPGQLDTEKSKQKLEEINKHENVIHRGNIKLILYFCISYQKCAHLKRLVNIVKSPLVNAIGKLFLFAHP